MGCEWLGHAALLCRLHMRPLIRGRHGCNEPCIEVASDHFGFFLHQSRRKFTKILLFYNIIGEKCVNL